MTETSTTYYPGHIAGADPDRVAVVMADSGASMTYAELDTAANRLSHYLRQLGLGPGNHVAICMENRLEFLAVIWGCHYAGLYYTAISTRLTDGEMAYIVNDCGAQVFITSPSMTEQALSLLTDTPRVRARLTVGGPVVGHIALDGAIESMPSHPLEGRLEATDMLYSSGTTGQPKGVKAPASNEPLGTMPALLRIAQPLLGIVNGCTYLSPAPLYHGAPLRFCLSVLRVGGTVVVMERFEPERCLALIEQHQVTSSQFVPTMFVRILKLDTAIRSRYELSSLTHVVVASAPCPVEVKERIIDWWGPVIHEYYAGTEGNGLCYISSEEWLAHKGSVGRPLLGDVHIVGDDGRELPVGEQASTDR